MYSVQATYGCPCDYCSFKHCLSCLKINVKATMSEFEKFFSSIIDWFTQGESKTKESSTKQQGVTVLGSELAAAGIKEQERVDAGGFAESPIGDRTFGDWPGSIRLLKPIQGELDLHILKLTQKYAEMNADERFEMRNSLCQGDMYTLFHYCSRATAFALRDSSCSEFLQNAFITLSMVDLERVDFRDAFRAIHFVQYGFHRLGLESGTNIELARNLAGNKMADIMTPPKAWMNETSDNRKIYWSKEVHTRFGVGFVSTWDHPYDPKIDLLDIGILLWNIPKGKNWVARDIFIGSEVPQWFFSVVVPEIHSVLERALGTIRVSAIPNPELDCPPHVHSLSVYVVECATPADAKILATKCIGKLNSRLTASFVHFKELCAIVTYDNSWKKDDLEDERSIQRFKEPVASILQNFQYLSRDDK